MLTDSAGCPPLRSSARMKHSEQFEAVFRLAAKLCSTVQANALMVLAEEPLDWELLHRWANGAHVVVAADTEQIAKEASAAGLPVLNIAMPEAPVYDKIGQSVIKLVAQELVVPGATVVILYSGLEPDVIDSVSVVQPGGPPGPVDRA